jgi:aminopeptidase 2
MASTATPQREILPDNVIPKHYRLSLTPDFNSFKFAGKVAVTLDVKKPTSSIVLNALELELHKANVTTAGKNLESKNIMFDEEKQEATFEFGEELQVKDEGAVLEIEFTGILNDKMAGFYRSSYIDAKTGDEKWLATTQMGPFPRCAKLT